MVIVMNNKGFYTSTVTFALLIISITFITLTLPQILNLYSNTNKIKIEADEKVIKNNTLDEIYKLLYLNPSTKGKFNILDKEIEISEIASDVVYKPIVISSAIDDMESITSSFSITNATDLIVETNFIPYDEYAFYTISTDSSSPIYDKIPKENLVNGINIKIPQDIFYDEATQEINYGKYKLSFKVYNGHLDYKIKYNLLIDRPINITINEGSNINFRLKRKNSYFEIISF